MGQGKLIPRAEAIAVAERLGTALMPFCERVSIAGSLRRGKREVSDIELVVEAKFEERTEGMFETLQHDLLEETIADWLKHDSGHIALREVETKRRDGSVERLTKNGPAYKALVADGLPVDLFIVRPPATWGVIFALRTGPGEWNIRLVDDCKAIGRKVEGGQVWRWVAGEGWIVMPTPTETDFFEAIGQRWIEPRLRSPDLVAIRRPEDDLRHPPF